MMNLNDAMDQAIRYPHESLPPILRDWYEEARPDYFHQRGKPGVASQKYSFMAHWLNFYGYTNKDGSLWTTGGVRQDMNYYLSMRRNPRRSQPRLKNPRSPVVFNKENEVLQYLSNTGIKSVQYSSSGGDYDDEVDFVVTYGDGKRREYSVSGGPYDDPKSNFQMHGGYLGELILRDLSPGSDSEELDDAVERALANATWNGVRVQNPLWDECDAQFYLSNAPIKSVQYSSSTGPWEDVWEAEKAGVDNDEMTFLVTFGDGSRREYFVSGLEYKSPVKNYMRNSFNLILKIGKELAPGYAIHCSIDRLYDQIYDQLRDVLWNGESVVEETSSTRTQNSPRDCRQQFKDCLEMERDRDFLRQDFLSRKKNPRRSRRAPRTQNLLPGKAG